MSSKHLIYTSGLTLYGSDLEGVASTATTPMIETTSTLYTGDTDTPYTYIQAGGAPDPETDTLVGDLRDQYYGSERGGDLFFLRRLHAWDYQNSPALDRVRALTHATYLIDKFNYLGTKVVSTQRLAFPRQCVDPTTGAVTAIDGGLIPDAIEEACYLIADALLSGRDPEEDFEALRNKVETFGPVRTEIATDKGPPQHLANLIPSPEAWSKIQPYLKISTSFTLNRG